MAAAGLALLAASRSGTDRLYRWVRPGSGHATTGRHASCLVAPGMLGGRDPAQRERHQRRG